MPKLMNEATDETPSTEHPMDTLIGVTEHVYSSAAVAVDEDDEDGEDEYPNPADELDDSGEIELDEETLLEKSRQLEQIQIAAVEVEKAQEVYEAAKRAATARKADWEDSVERLTNLIKASRESLPLFDRKPDAALVTVESDMNGAEGVQLATVPNFPEGVARALEEQVDITTVRQLAEFSKTKDLTLLKGVGPAKADAASDAMAEFWKDWNSKYPPNASGETQE